MSTMLCETCGGLCGRACELAAVTRELAEAKARLGIAIEALTEAQNCRGPYCGEECSISRRMVNIVREALRKIREDAKAAALAVEKT